MVKISSEFKNKIDKEVERRIDPKEGSSRKLLETGGRKCVTLDPRWVKQWGLEKKSKVLVFTDEEKRLVITPANESWKKEIGKKHDPIEKKIVNVGNSLAVSIPSSILKEKLEWEGKKLLRSTDYTTVYETYDSEKQDKIKKGEITPEKIIKPSDSKTGKKNKYIKLTIISLIIIGTIIGTIFYLDKRDETGPYELNMKKGTYENTVLIKERLQISPSLFLEEKTENWTFETAQKAYAKTDWDGWYTHGKGSIAIGSLESNIFLKPNEKISGNTEIDLNNIDTMLIDIYGQRTFPSRPNSMFEEAISVEISVENEVVFLNKNKNFEKNGFKIDVSNLEENSSIRMQMYINREEWNGLAVAPILAIDGLRSEKLKSNSGKLEIDWQKVKLGGEWENITIDATIPENTQAEAEIFSSNNGDSIKGSKTIQIENGTKNYGISNLNGDYIKAKIKLNTENIRKTPKIKSLKITS